MHDSISSKKMGFLRGPSRRQFLGGSLSAVAAFAAAGRMFPAQAAPMLDDLLIVDTHTHPGALYRGPSGSTPQALESIKKSKLSAAVFSVLADGPVIGRRGVIRRAFKDGESYEFVTTQLGKVRTLADGAGISILTSPDELTAAKAARAPGLILAIEGGNFAEGRLGAVADVYAAGVRVIQPGHYAPSAFTDLQKVSESHGGMTAEGKAFVRELNRQGIVVDISHMTKKASAHAIEASSAPVMLSHALLGNGGRFIDAGHAKLVASAGGLVGVWSMESTGTKDAFVGAFRKLADVVGVDHVGLGTDLDSTAGWFDGYDDLPDLVEALSKAGFSNGDIGKMLGGNFLRIFKAAADGRTAA